MIKVPTIEVVLFIVEAHGDHPPRMGGEPYYSHPIACVDILRNVLGVKTDESDQAMLVHDIEEDEADKGYTHAKLREMFGQPADLAHWLCKPPRDSAIDKFAFNLNCYYDIAKNAPEVCRQMKIADRLHNLSDPILWTDEFRQKYIKDTANLLLAFENVPNIDLVRQKYEIIRDGKY